MDNDWRITNQMNYLYRLKLEKVIFEKTENTDHEHCEFCWEKFGDSPENLHVGYATPDRYYWICETCFHDFKEMFEWSIFTH